MVFGRSTTLKITYQLTLSRCKCKSWAPTLVFKLNPNWSNSCSKREEAPIVNNALFTNLNAICATKIMSGALSDIYTSALTDTNTLQVSWATRFIEDWFLLQAIFCSKELKIKVCLIFEMLFIKELNPELNTQKDSIRAKLFTCLCVRILCYLHIFWLCYPSPRNSFTLYSFSFHSLCKARVKRCTSHEPNLMTIWDESNN